MLKDTLRSIKSVFAVGGIVSALSFTGCKSPDPNNPNGLDEVQLGLGRRLLPGEVINLDFRTGIGNVWTDMNRDGRIQPWELDSKGYVTKDKPIYIGIAGKTIKSMANYLIVVRTLNDETLASSINPEVNAWDYGARFPETIFPAPGNYKVIFYSGTTHYERLDRVFEVREK